jgi:aminoglycoside N3'-acetyltransferase
LRIGRSDVVFVHSGFGQIYATFAPGRVIEILLEVVGTSGTLLFPTFPTVSSAEFLQKGMVHDVRSTRSGMGAVTELARKRPGFTRTAHPVRSVCGIGPQFQDLVKDQLLTPYFYDELTPFFRLVRAGGKVIGLGVGSERCSFVHTADDHLKDDFPVAPYLPELYRAKCIDADGREFVLETYAHDISKMNHDVPKLMKAWVAPAIGEDLTHLGRRFFRADCAPLFDTLVQLAREGKTIYAPAVYKPGRIATH